MYANKVKAKLTGTGLPYTIGKRLGAPASPQLHIAMDAFDGDVIMATTAAYNFCDYPTWRFKTNNPKPFVLHGAIHLHKEPHAQDRAIIRAKTCDCYIANTEFEKNKLVEYGMQPNKIITAGIGVSIAQLQVEQRAVDEFKAAHNIQTSDFVIGFVGRLEVGKGVALLINAVRTLCKKHQHIKLLLAGAKTTYCSEIKRLITQENLPIILLENFDDSVKPLIYHAMNIFVLPSTSESFGVVFLEAWACKKPVLAARMGATASLIKDGKEGLLFELDNIDDLITKIEILIADQHLQTALGVQGYHKVLDNYTWEKIIPAYRQAYLLGIKNFRQLVHQKALAIQG